MIMNIRCMKNIFVQKSADVNFSSRKMQTGCNDCSLSNADPMISLSMNLIATNPGWLTSGALKYLFFAPVEKRR